MKFPRNSAFGVAVSTVLYMSFSQSAQASNWGCQVLLCLANPGSPTQYKECKPPINKLHRELAKGNSFPTCTGVGFSASKPIYEPYECPADYKLVTGFSGGSGGAQATCQKNEITVLRDSECRYSGGTEPKGKWYVINGKRICGMYEQIKPTVRDKPRRVDVTIDGVGKQTIWF